jgi:hypothetical protein
MVGSPFFIATNCEPSVLSIVSPSVLLRRADTTGAVLFSRMLGDTIDALSQTIIHGITAVLFCPVYVLTQPGYLYAPKLIAKLDDVCSERDNVDDPPHRMGHISPSDGEHRLHPDVLPSTYPIRLSR